MNLSYALFFLFAAVAASAATGVICAKNPVHAVLSLVLAFFATAGIWLLAQAEFLAIVLVLVYVGAVMVLFLFVVMMLDVDIQRAKGSMWGYTLLALAVGGSLLVLLVQWIWEANSQSITLPYVSSDYSNVTNIGHALFTDHILPFEVAGIILLAAIIAAIALTFRGRQGLNKAPNPGLQSQVTKAQRLQIIKMPAEQSGEKQS